MDNLHKLLKTFTYKRKMSERELDALLSELMASYLDNTPSPLMDYLIKDDFIGFQQYAKQMTEVGALIKKNISKFKIKENEND